MIGTLRSAVASWSNVPEDKIKKLGRAGAYEYAEYKGREYAVEVRALSDPASIVPGEGEFLVVRRVMEIVDGSRWETPYHHRAFPVAPGTFAKEEAKRRRRLPSEQPARAWDALGGLPSLHRREPLRIVADGRDQDPTLGALKAQIGAASPAVIEVGGSAGVERSAAGYAAWLASRGVELSVARGRLLAKSRKPLGLEERALLAEAEELLVGHLNGRPVVCSLCDSAAVSIALPRAPLCAEHLAP